MTSEEFIDKILEVASDATRPLEGFSSKKNAIRELIRMRISAPLNLLLNIEQTSAGPKDKEKRRQDLASRYGVVYDTNIEKYN